MTQQFIVTLSEAEVKALGYVAASPQEWIDTVVHNRCRIAIDEIVSLEVARKLEAGEPITGTKEEIVVSADVESAADRHVRLEAEMAAKMAAAQAEMAQGA